MSVSERQMVMPKTQLAPPNQGAALALGRSSPRKHLTFTLNGEVYAIAIEQIREIIGFRPMTTIPMMPNYLRGIINLRGMVVPVLDLACRFGLKPNAAGKRTCIVILNIPLLPDVPEQYHTLGLVVDMVNAVLDISPSTIEPAPSFGTNIRPDFLEGMARIKDEFILLLNLQQIVSLDELNALRSISKRES